MIADLKADSSRWDDERLKGQSANGTRDSNGNFRKPNAPVAAAGYTQSNTHQSRQYYGPTEAPAPALSGSGGAPQQEVFASGYGSAQNYNQASPGYGAPAPGYGAPQQPDTNYYVSGAHYGVNNQPTGDVDPRGPRNGPLQPAQVPRGGPVYPNHPPTTYPESRNPAGYYAPPGPQGQTSYHSPAHQGEAYYGRQSTYINEYISLAPSPLRRDISN